MQKTHKRSIDRLNSIDDKVLETLKELENGTENFITESELNTLLENYPTNEQLTTQLNGKANVGDVTNPQSVELPDFDKMIKEKVDEALANAQLQRFTFTDDNGYIPRIDNPDLYTMSGIDASGFIMHTTQLIHPIQIIKAVIYLLWQVVVIRKCYSSHSIVMYFIHAIRWAIQQVGEFGTMQQII